MTLPPPPPTHPHGRPCEGICWAVHMCPTACCICRFEERSRSGGPVLSPRKKSSPANGHVHAVLMGQGGRHQNYGRVFDPSLEHNTINCADAPPPPCTASYGFVDCPLWTHLCPTLSAFYSRGWWILPVGSGPGGVRAVRLLSCSMGWCWTILLWHGYPSRLCAQPPLPPTE